MFFVRIGRLIVIAAVVVLLCNCGFSRQCREVRAKLDKVNTHIVNKLKEVEDSDVMRSHGRLDVILQLKARSMGRKLTIVKDGE